MTKSTSYSKIELVQFEVESIQIIIVDCLILVFLYCLQMFYLHDLFWVYLFFDTQSVLVITRMGSEAFTMMITPIKLAITQLLLSITC